MPVTIPTTIVVHLGPPASAAANVRVPYADYLKNVACSEIYPTWETAAIRANALAEGSFALNRVFTQYYRSQGYDFDITATTAFDQKFIRDRNIFDRVSEVVDDVFNSYIRRRGYIEPLSAKFCNGTTVTCPGLSQWGSQELARQGLDSVSILKYYYGEDIEIVTNVPLQDPGDSFPGVLRRGAFGRDVLVIQRMLNRVARDYPAMETVWPETGYFGAETEAAVRRFQQIFRLEVDGIVGKNTWYRLVRLYTATNRLAELDSLGERDPVLSFQPEGDFRRGDRGAGVSALQFMLSVLAQFYDVIPAVEIDGIFGAQTENAVRAFQTAAGLAATGVADEGTWDVLYRVYAAIEDEHFDNGIRFPVMG